MTDRPSFLTTGVQRQVRLNNERERKAVGATLRNEVLGIQQGMLDQSGRSEDEVVFTVEGEYVVARMRGGQ